MGENIEAKKRVPIEEGLFTLPSSPSEEPHLLGSRCKHCGELFFPEVAACAKCFGQDMEELILSRRGHVHSSTVVSLAPPLYEGPVPYSFGVVKVPEGVLVPTVFAEFKGWPQATTWLLN